MSFESILASIAEETDRTTLDSMAKKYPSLREYAELGEKVHALKPRLKALSGTDPKQDYETYPNLAVEEVENWRAWKKTKWVDWQAESDARVAALEAAQAKIAEYEARTNTEMTPEEIKSVVTETLKTGGFLTAAELDTRLTAALEKFGSERVIPTMNTWGSRVQDIYTKLTPKALQYAKEFGEDLDLGAVIKHMDENKITDAVKAFEAVTGPKYAEKREADHQKAIEKAKADGIKEGRSAVIAATGKASPADGGKGVAPAGMLQRRYAAKMEKLKQEGVNAKLGSGHIAQQAAREHYEKEAAGAAA